MQHLPYLWNEFRSLQKEGIPSFLAENPPFQEALRKMLHTSRRIEQGEWKDAHEAHVVRECIKSLIQRISGSNKSGWITWMPSSSFSYSPRDSVTLSLRQSSYHIPHVAFLSLPSSVYERMKEATSLIFSHVDPYACKHTLRVDFLLELRDGELFPWLVDVGESHFTLSLASYLFQREHIPLDILDIFSTIIHRHTVAEKGKPKQLFILFKAGQFFSMPWEFLMLQDSLVSRCMTSTLCNESLFSRLLSSESFSPSSLTAVRFFRKVSEENLCTLLEAEANGLTLLDSVSYLSSLEKSSTRCLLSHLAPILRQYVGVPSSTEVVLSRVPERDAQQITSWAENERITDIVIKPGQRSFQPIPNAFFYHLPNDLHRADLVCTLEKLSKIDTITSVVVEELVGSGLIDNKKTEVRMWAFRTSGCACL